MERRNKVARAMIDPTKIDSALSEAQAQHTQAEGALHTITESIGMTRKYNGHDPQLELVVALQTYVSAAVRVGVLEFFTTPHFYDAMMRSAAEKNQ